MTPWGMTTWGRLPARRQRALLVLAVAVTGAGGYVGGRVVSDTAHVQTVRGEVERVAIDGVGVRLADRKDPDAVYFVGTAQSWTDVEGSTHGPGQPECLPPDSRGAMVELGVVPELDGGHRNQVVWVRCITLPTGFVLGDDATAVPLDNAYQQAVERDS